MSVCVFVFSISACLTTTITIETRIYFIIIITKIMCVCVCVLHVGISFVMWRASDRNEISVRVCFFHLVERAYSFLVCRNPDGNARNFGSHKLCIYICVGIMPSINHTMEMRYSCASSHWLLYNRERNSKFSEKSCLFWWLLSIAVERRWLTENSTGKH